MKMLKDYRNFDNYMKLVRRLNKIENPLDFYEFIKALGGAKYLDLLSSFDLHREVPAYIYEPLLQYLKLYYIVGGMPEAVKSYIETEDLTKVDQVLDRIIQDLRNDFAHHAEPKDIIKIGWVWDSIPKQLAKDNNKFVFQDDFSFL